MPALRKPHRVAFLVPSVGVDGADVAFEREAALLLWIACIETCQRHPGLAVYDAEATPLVPREGHFTPANATIGATLQDAFYRTTRRDELVWLELGLSNGSVRLHTLARGDRRESFEASGKQLGDQIQQVLSAWLAARGLTALPRRFDPVSSEELLAIVRTIGPILVAQARAWALPVSNAPVWTEDAGENEIDIAVVGPAARIARPIANRLPAPLKVAALRLLQLALREELDDLVLALDPDHPQARFAALVATKRPDFTLLRRVIAAAPCWARPYSELISVASADETPDPLEPTELESVAGAGIAALCRPAQLEVLEIAAELLDDAGLVDEGVRLLDRALAAHPDQPRVHVVMLDQVKETDREGTFLARAEQSTAVHGCPADPTMPRSPEQIQIDLLHADALLRVGRFDEAVALRASRLDGREASWPRHSRILATWKSDARFLAWSYAREGHFRGDPDRTIEGFGRIEPRNHVDVAALFDALIATGRENQVVFAWAQFVRAERIDGPVARLAAAHALLVAGEWVRGLEEMWRVELGDPGRDEHVAIARCGLLMSCAPIEVLEAAIGARIALGANTLARRMARDIADFHPDAASSQVISRALKSNSVELDLTVLDAFTLAPAARRSIDAVFADLTGAEGSVLERADRFVERWLDLTFAHGDEPSSIAQTAVYIAGQALGRYLAATTDVPSPVAGALRTVAGEALALVRMHRAAVVDQDARAILAVLDSLLRRVDRWVGSAWLATVERVCGIDERADGDVAGFAPRCATVAARIVGPEEAAVLAASIARLHRERPERWAAAVDAQASQLALHTGYLAADEWSDAIVTQLATREIETADAIDALLTACYLVEGSNPRPAMHAARVLLGAGRGPAALAVLSAGLGAATPEWRDQELATLAPAWGKLERDVPLAFDKVAREMLDAFRTGDPVRAEQLGRWAVVLDPSNEGAHRNLGLAFARQGNVVDAFAHLVLGTHDQAAKILAGALYQAGHLVAATDVLDYASHWYQRAEQWLAYGGIAHAASDVARTVTAYRAAFRLEPVAFDATQLHAYASALDEARDYQTLETVANRLLQLAGADPLWKSTAWHHLACAYVGQTRFIEAEKHATDAVALNPLPDNAAAFAATLQRARSKVRHPPRAVVERIPAGTWRARRAALEALRFRSRAENHIGVPRAALAGARAILADTTGLVDRDATSCRALALQIREQAYFARDVPPRLGERPVLETPVPSPQPVDRIVVPDCKVEHISDYVELLHDLAALTPGEAIAQFDLDHVGYVEIAKAWAAAIEADPTIAKAISWGLTKR